MPREKVIKKIVYKFEELPKNVQDRVLENLWDINVEYEWWEFTLEDAKQIGLEIREFEIAYHNTTKGKFMWSAKETADAILLQHGESCETYKTAKNYLDELKKLEKETPEDNDVGSEELDKEFLYSLLEDYRIILKKEFEYLTSREGILETIEINEYEFTIDGKIG